MRMEVTESTNSNPPHKVKGRDLLIFQISVFYCMSLKYKYQDIGSANQEKLEKGIQLYIDKKVHQYDDNALRFYVEGEERHEVNLSSVKCTCQDFEFRGKYQKPDELGRKCKHIHACVLYRKVQIGEISIEGVKV